MDIFGTDVGDQRHPQTCEDGAEDDGEESPVFEELLRPVVHNPRDERLHVTELTVDTEDQQHHEEDGGPEDGAGQGEDEVGVGEEDQAGPAVDHIVNGGLLYVSHVAEDREDQDPGQQAGQGVDYAGDYSVPGNSIELRGQQ